MSRLLTPGGGEGVLGKVKNRGLRTELERENAGLRSELECEIKVGVSGTDCKSRLAGTLAGR